MPDDAPEIPPVLFPSFIVVVAVVGFYIGWAALLPLFIVVVLALFVGVPAHFLTSGNRRRMVPAGAVMAGHGLWMFLGVLVMVEMGAPAGPDTMLVLLEGILLTGGALVVIVVPHLQLVLLLSGYQLILLVTNVGRLTTTELPRELQGALIVHVLVRLLGVALLWAGYLAQSSPDRRAGPASRQSWPGD